MSGVRVTRGKDGVWFCRPYLGTNALTGKPMRPYRRFPGASGEAEARELAQEWVNTLAPAAGLRVSMRVGDVLSRYIAKIEADGAGANTVKTYRSMLRCYVEPYIGRADVGDVEPYVVDGLYFTLLTEGGRDGQGIAASNVLDSVTKPRPQPREAAAYDEADFAKLSAALAEELARDEGGRSAVMRRNCAMAAYLALWTGMRCGEVCALARPDVRLAARTALVRATMVETPSGLVRQPKTKGKRSRSVSLYGETAERVRAHLDWQAAYLPKGLDARRLGVCCDADGGFLRPSAVSAWFSGLRDELGLQRGTSFHTLRHTHATWLLLQGVDPKTVMERLGHAKVTTTLELYGHVLPGRDAAAAQAFAEAASMAGGTP